MKKGRNVAELGILTAITASLCCIAPLLAILAGTGGAVSNFSFLEPFRPYLIGFTFLVLAYAWYVKLKPDQDVDCECEPEKERFINSKSFLGTITLLSILLLSFPYYSGALINSNKVKSGLNQTALATIKIPIQGMTCAGCEEHINHALFQLDGVLESKASYKKGNAEVHFDKSKISESNIREAVNSTGYKAKLKADSVSIYELNFKNSLCSNCIDNVHSNLVKTDGVIEVCSFYNITNKSFGDSSIVAVISIDESKTSMNKIKVSIEDNSMFQIASINKKNSFNEQ